MPYIWPIFSALIVFIVEPIIPKHLLDDVHNSIISEVKPSISTSGVVNITRLIQTRFGPFPALFRLQLGLYRPLKSSPQVRRLVVLASG